MPTFQYCMQMGKRNDQSWNMSGYHKCEKCCMFGHTVARCLVKTVDEDIPNTKERIMPTPITTIGTQVTREPQNTEGGTATITEIDKGKAREYYLLSMVVTATTSRRLVDQALQKKSR